MRVPFRVAPWLPMTVNTPFRFANPASTRASQIVLHIGFCTMTCLPRRMASMAIGKCMWSGVETVTTSILSAIWSNISR